MEKKEKKLTVSWFWKWFLNNKVVTGLLILLLILLNIAVFTKVSYLFAPIGQFVATVGLPVIMAGILFYLLNPVVDFLEKKGLRRIYGIILVFILLIALIAWGVVVIIPAIRDQILQFADNLPGYIDVVQNGVKKFFSDPIFDQVQKQLSTYGERLMNTITNIVQNVSKSTFKGIGNFFGAIASTFIAIVTMPFILFYLLKDGKDLAPFMVDFLPTKMRKPSLEVLGEMNTHVSSYIVGQLTVASAVALMFMVGFSIIGLDYAISLGIIAGFMNLIPYLGSFLAMVPAVFLGIVGGPALLVKVLIVFGIEQIIEGRVISPLVLGSQLSIHPITILFVLLTSGKLFGVVGVLLGVPAYAAIKVVVTNIFAWYKRVSGLYNDDTIIQDTSDEINSQK